MSTTTRLARVIGLTRSFSLPGGSRNEAGDMPEAADPVEEALVMEERATIPALSVETVESTAIVQVTTVDAEPASGAVATAPAEAVAAASAADGDTRALGAGLFDEIEADMASLLAALETVGSDRRPAAPIESDEDEAVAAEEDARSFALLSELNRLWANEPNQSAN